MAKYSRILHKTFKKFRGNYILGYTSNLIGQLNTTHRYYNTDLVQTIDTKFVTRMNLNSESYDVAWD